MKCYFELNSYLEFILNCYFEFGRRECRGDFLFLEKGDDVRVRKTICASSNTICSTLYDVNPSVHSLYLCAVENATLNDPSSSNSLN